MARLMMLDVPTLLIVAVFIAALAGVLLIVSWLQARKVTALVHWGTGYLFAAVATLLFAGRGVIADVWSIMIANALLLTGAGLVWCGLRVFERREARLWQAGLGGAIWLVLVAFEPFHSSIAARVALVSSLMAIYAALGVWELWQARADGLVARWLAIVVFALHGGVLLLRIPVVGLSELPPQADLFDLPWIALGLFEGLFFIVASAFILLMLTREQAEARHRREALIDPLTTVPNRRGFILQAEDLLGQCQRESRSVCLLLFDLDHFKRINDTYGHQIGDEILATFCRVVETRLGPGDLLGRLGGEEFGCLLPDASSAAAFALAERIRSDFDALHFATRAGKARATVSVGIAHSGEAGYELGALVSAADRALYEAKAKGRNRVEGRRAAIALVPEAAGYA